ncbi:kappaPI-actitoxin-Ael3a-like [Rhagoletis pomonella]|uniref:kappaPI-actitoxin-Ael3a-like n=1 Tax=Rhagoletis pomonella TaxID=28610 RepID=UPI00178257AB|nr:kappaPI-actitoxin-Ael3a-like [Rhagoletis pomonella]
MRKGKGEDETHKGINNNKYNEKYADEGNDKRKGIPETCLLPMDFGYCRAKVKRYYFDMRSMKCAMLYFGGCAGNVNNFKSLEECNRVCLNGYGDYDSPNDVVAVNKVASGRD